MKLSKTKWKLLITIHHSTTYVELKHCTGLTLKTMKTHLKELLEIGVVKLDDMGWYVTDPPVLFKLLDESTKRTPDPNTTEMQAWWSWAFHKKNGRTYRWNYAEDLTLFKRLLAQYDVDEIKFAAMLYFKEARFITVKDFYFRFNSLFPTKSFKRAAEKLLTIGD